MDNFNDIHLMEAKAERVVIFSLGQEKGGWKGNICPKLLTVALHMEVFSFLKPSHKIRWLVGAWLWEHCPIAPLLLLIF